MGSRVPLSRGAQLFPFTDFLDRLGAPTERGLERHKLPPGLRERSDMLVSTRAMFGFVADMARREGIEDFGWRAAAPQLTQMSPRLRGALLRSPSLLHALERMCAGACGESSNLQVWLEERGESFFLCHRGSLKLGVLGSDDAATMRTALIISVMVVSRTPSGYRSSAALRLKARSARSFEKGCAARRFSARPTTVGCDCPVRFSPGHREAGFSDPAHFSRFFRALSGVSPREYRVTHLSGP